MRSVIFKIRFLNNNNYLFIFKSFIFFLRFSLLVLLPWLNYVVKYCRKTNKVHLVTQYNENDSK